MLAPARARRAHGVARGHRGGPRGGAHRAPA
jgi:hypothetical protein